MGWIQKCCETYDNNIHMVGVQFDDKFTLAPYTFVVKNAEIEIAITKDGEFCSAQKIDNVPTLIPATEESLKRTGDKPNPHPLCDELKYCATELGLEAYYKSYFAQLEQWINSEYSHFMPKAVYTYCKKGTVISDLIAAGLISESKRDSCGKTFVRWIVLNLDTADESWLNEGLIKAFGAFRESVSSSNKGTCYITGEETSVTDAFPSLRRPKTEKQHAKAKVVSANDKTNFTYRGRFLSPGEAVSLGSKELYKADSALSWVANNQGVYYGERLIVCWNPKGKPVLNFDFDDFNTDEDDKSVNAYTMPQYTEKLKRAIAGSREVLDDNDDVIILAMQAISDGRVSITYYNELKASGYRSRIEKWQSTCCWHLDYKGKDGRKHSTIFTPCIKDIIRFAYGSERRSVVEVDDRVISANAQRVLNCIVDGAQIPSDLVKSISTKASARQAYKSEKGGKSYNYEKLLSIACALIRKYHNDRMRNRLENANNEKGDKWIMELDRTCTDRSYLFGRLLAVCEKIERRTYDPDEWREPAAVRLQAAFAAHPMHTWKVLYESMTPYFAKLNPGARMYYRNEINEIWHLMPDEETSKLNLPLAETYLLGYYLERMELNGLHSKNNDNPDKLNDDE